MERIMIVMKFLRGMWDRIKGMLKSKDEEVNSQEFNPWSQMDLPVNEREKWNGPEEAYERATSFNYQINRCHTNLLPSYVKLSIPEKKIILNILKSANMNLYQIIVKLEDDLKDEKKGQITPN